MVNVISREEWGAAHSNGCGADSPPYEGIYLHHSVTLAPDLVAPFDDDYAAVRSLDNIGQQRFGCGISYTWATTPVGLMFEGHSVDRRGAHTGGLNSLVRAVVMVGDYSTNPPTAAQIQAIGELVKQENESGRSQSAVLLGGHRDANARVGRPPTGCPGDAGHAAIFRINAVAAGGTAEPTYVVPEVKPEPAPHAPPPAHGDFLPYDFPLPGGHWFGRPSRDPRNHSGFYGGKDNHYVRTLQEGLRSRGWGGITVDGKYGDQMVDVVGKFQREKGLAVDGLTGPATWSAIDRSPKT